MIPASFDYEAPRTLGEALAMLASRPDAKLLAGGHSLLPAMKLRVASAGTLIDLGRIAGLSYIRHTGDGFAIGSMTRHAEIAGSDLLHALCPLLAQAASAIGDVQVRNAGTIGGSLAAAHPAADYPAAVLALDGEMVAMSQHGDRVIPARDFFTGLFTTALQSDEILTEVRLRSTAGSGSAYKKFRHPASGFAVVGVAANVWTANDKIVSASVGITGVGEHAYRAAAVESALRGKPASAIAEASSRAAEGVTALSDNFASADYRLHLARIYTRRALEQAAGGAS